MSYIDDAQWMPVGVGVTLVVDFLKWGFPIPEERVASAIKHHSQVVAC